MAGLRKEMEAYVVRLVLKEAAGASSMGKQGVSALIVHVDIPALEAWKKSDGRRWKTGDCGVTVTVICCIIMII